MNSENFFNFQTRFFSVLLELNFCSETLVIPRVADKNEPNASTILEKNRIMFIFFVTLQKERKLDTSICKSRLLSRVYGIYTGTIGFSLRKDARKQSAKSK